MKTIKTLLIACFCLFSTPILFAAPAPGPTGSGGTGLGGPSCWPPPCVPIDNGIALLIIAGAAYGAKKIYDSKKKSEISI